MSSYPCATGNAIVVGNPGGSFTSPASMAKLCGGYAENSSLTDYGPNPNAVPSGECMTLQPIPMNTPISLYSPFFQRFVCLQNCDTAFYNTTCANGDIVSMTGGSYAAFTGPGVTDPSQQNNTTNPYNKSTQFLLAYDPNNAPTNNAQYLQYNYNVIIYTQWQTNNTLSTTNLHSLSTPSSNVPVQSLKLVGGNTVVGGSYNSWTVLPSCNSISNTYVDPGSDGVVNFVFYGSDIVFANYAHTSTQGPGNVFGNPIYAGSASSGTYSGQNGNNLYAPMASINNNSTPYTVYDPQSIFRVFLVNGQVPTNGTSDDGTDNEQPPPTGTGTGGTKINWKLIVFLLILLGAIPLAGIFLYTVFFKAPKKPQ